MLRELTCSNCNGAGLELEPDGSARCRYCGTVNALGGIVCPQCEWLNAAEAEACAHCRGTLWHVCRACGRRSWSGTEQCPQCGASLDTLARMGPRLRPAAGHWLDVQDGAAAIKAEEDATSRQRMAELEAIEARRLTAALAARERQAARDRRLMVFVAIGLTVFAGLTALGILAFGFR
jgi:hypothetical protein